MSYSDLDAKLRTKAGNPADSRKLGNNTYGVRLSNGDIAVRLHNTDVVTWHPDETVTLNTGGWYTVTTKARINDWAGPFGVRFAGGTWHVTVRNPAYDPNGGFDAQRGIPYHLTVGPFYDGITLDAKNPTAVLAEPAEVQAARLADAETKRAVAKYVKGITNEPFTKVCDLGRYDVTSTANPRVYVKVTWDGRRLSISGVQGPTRDGNCRGSAGQIIISDRRMDHRGHHDHLGVSRPAEGWTYELIDRLADVWDRWHLNDMRAGSQVQRAHLDTLPRDAWRSSGGDYYSWAVHELTKAGLNPDPDGYKYGHGWAYEEVPTDVLDFLRNLPDAKTQPAWV